MARILIVVDMQNDFVKGHMSTPRAREIIGPVREKIEAARREGRPVLFTMDTHLDRDYEEPSPTAEAAALPKHCIRGGEGWKIVEELAPYAPPEALLEKPTFLGLELAERVEAAAGQAPEEIELCGVCTDICVLSNALYLRARFPRAKITVDSACCAGVTPESHRAALLSMKSCLIGVE